MSMILLEPAKHDLHNSLEDQAADHLINGVFGNFNLSDSNFPKRQGAKLSETGSASL
jgi:hypothetical protein